MASVVQTQAHLRTPKAALSEMKTSVKHLLTGQIMFVKIPKKLSNLIPFLKTSSTRPVVGFNCLPAEIRHQIWQLFLEDESHDRFIIVDTYLQKIMPLHITAVSPLLSLNRETRALALQAYPQKIAIKKIDKWEHYDNTVTASPASGAIPASYGPECGILRYNAKRDKFICGMRYAVLDDKEKAYYERRMWEVKQKYAMGVRDARKHRVKLNPKYLQLLITRIRVGVPLYFRYTSVRLPEHTSPDFPQVHNVIGLQMWWNQTVVYELESDVDSVQTDDHDQDQEPGEQGEEEEEEEDEDEDEDDEEEVEEYWDPSEDTIGPWLNHEHHSRNFFPQVNRELNALFPGSCLCGKDFDPVGYGYCFCRCMHIPVREGDLRNWLLNMDKWGLPWFRDVNSRLREWPM